MRYFHYDEGTFMDSRGTKIFYRVWRPRRVKGVVALFHALGLHSGRYSWFCEELASRGVGCYAVDLYGHGLSEGPRGGSLKGLLASGEKFLQLIAAKHNHPNLIVVGHGCGVVIALRSAENIGLKPRLLAIAPLHEIATLLRKTARLRVLSLLNLRTEIHPQPLYDADHSDARLEVEEDNLVVSRVPAKLVLGLIGLARRGVSPELCVTVFATEENGASKALLAKVYTCGKELHFNPRSDPFPFDRVIELLSEGGGPPNRRRDVGGGSQRFGGP